MLKRQFVRSFFSLVLIALVLESSNCIPSQAQNSATAMTVPEIVFQPMTDTIQPGNVTVVNGHPTKPQDWPALVVARMSLSGPSGNASNLTCSATLVGPRVLLTAAHCIDGKNSQLLKTAAIKLDGILISMQCAASPKYLSAPVVGDAPRDSADYALCLLSMDLSQSASYQTLQYEVMAPQSTANVGNSVLVTGYGCTSIQYVGGTPAYGPFVGTLRVGNATISDTPGAFSVSESDYFKTRSVNNNQAALCPGDSGGPLMTGVTADNQTGPRRVIAINSSIQPMGANDLTSSFAALTTADFRNFLNSWITQSNNPIVCGVNRSAGTFPCRS